MTELLLMFASRAQAASEIIIPALGRSEIVVTDRFTDSTLAYQGAGRGLGFETVLQAHRLALGSLFPDLTICIAIDVETGLERAYRRNQKNEKDASEARLDRQSLEFHLGVSKGYQRIAELESQRFRMVDGDGEPAAVATRVWAEVSPLLSRLADPRIPIR